MPEAYGGRPTRYKLYLEVVKIISEACASTGIIYATNFHGMKPLIDFGSEEQKQRLLPRIAEGGLGSLAITEPNAGSDATGMTTRFTPDGDHIVVDGGKIFITNGDVADLLLVFGKWSEIDDARAAISALIVEKDTPGFTVGPPGRQDGPLRGVRHRRAQLRQAPRAARQSASAQPGDGLEDPARVAQQVAPQHRRACAGHRHRRVQGHDGLHEHAPAVGPAHRRVPGQPVPAGRPGERAGACARLGSTMWPI